MKYVGNTDVSCLCFYFMSPKWTRTKIVIEITPLLQVYSCLPLVQVGYRFLGIDPKVLNAISFVLVVHSNENPFHHIHICKFAFKLLTCEAVNFSRSPLACTKGRQITIFWHVLLRDSWLAGMHVSCDGCMMSLVFTACATTCGMMWHDSCCM